jgi:hypothetical protein
MPRKERRYQPQVPPIRVSFTNERLTRYGFFPAIAKFFIDHLFLKERFKQVTVPKQRNRDFAVSDLCLSMVSLPVLGIPYIWQINDCLRDEPAVAGALGLKRIFDQSTLHRFLNRFAGWHVNQLEKIHVQLLQQEGQSLREETIILDIDASTHSLRGTKRQGASPGRNTKAKGKDCYQWSVSFCAGELICQKLDAGHVHCINRLQTLLEKSKQILGRVDLLRVDGGYTSKETLTFLVEEKVSFLAKIGNQYGIVKALKKRIPQTAWKPYDENTWLYNAGIVQVLEGCPKPLRLIMVCHANAVKKVSKGRVFYRTKYIYYGIVAHLYESHRAAWIFQTYQKRQTVEQFFKEGNQSFNTGKMPSQRFRANQAYLYFMGIGYNCFLWFKKNFTDAFATVHVGHYPKEVDLVTCGSGLL